MNNSVSSGSSILSSMLTAKKDQPSSAAPSSRDAPGRHIDQSSAAREAADFRATMNEIAVAKAQVRRENHEQILSKKLDQQIAAQHAQQKAQQRSLDQERALHKQRSVDDVADSGSIRQNSPPGPNDGKDVSAVANRTDKDKVDNRTKKVEDLDTESSAPTSVNAGENPLHAEASEGGISLGAADAAALAGMGGEASGESTTEGSLVLNGDATATAPLSALNPDGIHLPPLAANPALVNGQSAGFANGEGSVDGIASGANETAALSLDVATKSGSGKANGELSVTDPAAENVSAGNKLSPNDDSILTTDELNKPFDKLLAAAQANREGQALNQEVAALKTTATNPQLLESATRPAETQAPATRAFVVQTGVPMTMGQPRWGEVVGERVLWLAAQNVSSADIRLDPPELGPMQVRISVNQDQASISFSSPHMAVREALDQGAVRLREMFNEQGLNLVNVDVSDQPMARHHQASDHSNGGSGRGSDAESGGEETVVGVTTHPGAIRLVDHYA